MHGCRIGVAQVDITPNWTGPTAGWGIGLGNAKAVPPSDPTERLYVTAVALSDAAGELVVLATTDLHCAARPVWLGAAKIAGIDPSRLILSGSHTHEGPGQIYGGAIFAFGSASLRGLRRNRRHLVEATGRAVKQAVEAMAPGGAVVVRGPLDDVGNNRAVPAWKHYSDETIDEFMTQGPGRSLGDRTLKAERYRDPRITLLVAATDDGRQRGVLGWYGVHAGALGQKWPTYSADIYGWARRGVMDARPGAVVGFGGGSAADVSPLPLDDAGHLRPPGASLAEVQGSELAGRVGGRIGAAVADLVAASTPAPFSVAVTHDDWRPTDTLPRPMYGMSQLGGGVDGPTSHWAELEAGIESPRANELAHRKIPLDKDQGPKIPWIHAVTKLPIPLGWLHRLTLPRTYPVHVARVGSHVFATVPGEPSTMVGWRIEKELLELMPTSTASVIGYAGDFGAYWVTPEEYLEQRYEAGSTLYGRHASSELQKKLASLARKLPVPAAEG
ncbi:MAG: neutral/alkaline non-lysosomal ceramidase N-terminal domain-containing protein [Acidimicrobiia bacterium]|nr:neutral/alkaline non-lysosomal ceramidase N-terminal domain-containing protein [Acidimicrobiia bacterium]